MTQCQHLFLVHAYHDGELPPAQVEVIEAHLRECPQCAAELAALKQISTGFRTAQRPAVPLQLVSQIHRRIDQTGDVGALRLTWRMTAAAAIILLACVVRLEVDTHQPTPGALLADSTATAADVELSDSPALNDERQLTRLISDDLSNRMAMTGQDNRAGE